MNGQLNEGVVPRVGRRSRRTLLQAIAGGAGGLCVMVGLGPQTARLAVARSDDDDDEDHSGHGGGDDRRRDDEAAIGDLQTPPGSALIQILDDDGFTPPSLTVNPGQSITFVNLDNDDHTATGSGFDTGIIVEEGGMATVVLDEPGTYPFACQIHPEMVGSIGVVGPDGTVPPPAPAAALPDDATVVEITNFAFSPPSVSVPIGGTVAWTNADPTPHTVTALDGDFDSGILDPNGGFSQTFSTPGTFAYRCDLHPRMQGEVIVGGEAAATSSEQPAEETNANGAAAESGADDPALVGSWLVELTPADDGTSGSRHALIVFRPDGTAEVDVSAASDASDALAGPAGHGFGTWEADDAGGYTTDCVALLLDEQNQYVGTLILRDAGQFDDADDTLTGTFRLEIRPASDDERVTETGESSGSRIDFESEPDASPARPVEGETDEPLAPIDESTTPATTETIGIEDFAFNPPTIEVSVGTTITWENRGEAPHTATADDGTFDTDRIDPGQQASETFAEAGSFAYTCSFHPDMQGTITVV